MPSASESRAALQKFQNAVAQWPQARWARLFLGVVSLLASVLLLSALFDLAGLIEGTFDLGKEVGDRDVKQRIVSWAVLLSLRATLGGDVPLAVEL